MQKLRVFSTFTGIGGFEVGIHNAAQDSVDVELVGYSEIDKYAVSVFNKHFKGVKNYGDITKIKAENLPDFDCLVGGFPCQAFSIAGKRAGFSDTRGTLFFDLARILQAKQPRLFVFENVKGLLNHDSGNTFKTIIKAIDELGYDCQWQVINSKNHGVPQNRERIIIVGHLRGSARPQVFPITRQNSTAVGKGQKVISLSDRRKKANISDTFNTLSASFRGHPDGDVRPAIIQLNNPTHSNDRVYSADGIAPTPNTMQGGNRQPFIIDDTQGFDGVRQFEISPTLRSQRAGLKVAIPEATQTHTLTAQDQHGVLLDGAVIRRLTPLECERLQAFPDGWTEYNENDEPISDTQRYKMCGNAVTTNVIQAVFEKIFASGK